MVASYCTVAGEGVPDFVVAVQILGPRSEIAVVQKNGFPRRLQMLREKRRLSRRTLAELCGLSGNMIGMYERGEKAPSVDALVRLADYFGVSTDYLLGRKNFSSEHPRCD